MRQFLRRLAVFLVFFLLGPVMAQAQAVDGPSREILAAVVRLEAEAPADARSARTLGPKRSGNGVVIDQSGLILTIGYLIVEAMSVTVMDAEGRPVPAEVVGYDNDTGFGLVRATKPLGIKPLPFGESSRVAEGDPVLVVGHGGAEGTVGGYVVSKREFAGYWEYLLDQAIFVSPPHGNWGGTALVSQDGRLVGIGSLLVQDAIRGSVPMPGNMFVPIDLLKPIFAELLADGRPGGPYKPWMGLLSTDHPGLIVVTRVTPDGPAAKAGIQPGDVIVAVGTEQVTKIADFYRKVWGVGPAGSDIPLTVMRPSEGKAYAITIPSGNRYEFMQFKRTF
jgi:S1-C subfamily serine protease